MKKTLLLFAMIMFVAISYGQRISTMVAAGDTVVIFTDTTYIEVSEVGATNATKAIRPKGVLDLKADLASPVFTGVPTIPSPFTLGVTSMTASGTELNQTATINATTISAVQWALQGAMVIQGDSIIFIIGGDTARVYVPIAARTDIDTVVQLLSDTRSFSVTLGVGNDGDTIGFTLNNVIYGFLNDSDHNMVFEKVTGVVYGDSPDIDIALLSHANFRDGSPVTMLNSDLTITSTTTGDDGTSWNDATLASGEYMWVRIDQATALPKQLVLTFSFTLTE